MLEIDDQQKVNILRDQLNERYNALHKMRERSMSFAIWILGFGIAIIWAALKENGLTQIQSYTLMALTLFVIVLTLYFLAAIARGFTANQRIAGDIEKALGLHTKDFFVSKETLLPAEYANGNRNPVWSSHFVSLYALVAGIGIAVFFVILFSPQKTQGSGYASAHMVRKQATMRAFLDCRHQRGSEKHQQSNDDGGSHGRLQQ